MRTMDILKLASDLLSEEKKKVVQDLVIEEIAADLKPLGWSLIRTEELQRIKNSTRLPKPKDTKTAKKPIIIHGETHKSIADAARYYGIDAGKLYNWNYTGRNLDELIEKKSELKLTAQEVDDQGFVTKIRRP